MHITLLSRSSTKGKQFGGSGIKYFIDCIEDIHKESCFEIIRNIKNKKVLYAKNKEDFAIIQAILTQYVNQQKKNKTQKNTKSKTRKTYSKKSTLPNIMKKPIVIKTWIYAKGYEHIYKEFNIGKQLKNIPGFIKYIAFIRCHDDSYIPKTNQEITEEIQLTKKSRKDVITMKLKNENICQGSSDMKQLLIMPYYNISIGNSTWNESQSNQLKSLFEQILWSCYVAFNKYGFIHNDMHLQNFFAEETDAIYSTYDFVVMGEPKQIKINTHGLKIIIMDFERSITNDYPLATRHMDVHTMLLASTNENAKQYQQVFTEVIKQKMFWEDFKRLFGELDDIPGVIIRPKTNVDIQILTFLKTRIELFSSKIVHETVTEPYDILIQKLYHAKTNLENTNSDVLQENIEKEFYKEVEKLYSMISTMDFVNR